MEILRGVISAVFIKKGKGGMAVSNSIGSNTFDILICLGVPWFIRALFTGFHDEIWFVGVQSDALAYTVVSLLISLIVLYCILVASRFVLSKTLGIICLAIYAVFLTISLLFELNVFYQVNLPTLLSIQIWTNIIINIGALLIWRNNNAHRPKVCERNRLFFWKKILVKTQQQDYMNSTYLMNFNKTKKT